jgi:hypothetical protein
MHIELGKRDKSIGETRVFPDGANNENSSPNLNVAWKQQACALHLAPLSMESVRELSCHHGN